MPKPNAYEVKPDDYYNDNKNDGKKPGKEEKEERQSYVNRPGGRPS